MLRQIRPDDFDDLYRMNSDPLIMKYVGDGSVRTHEQMIQELDMLISHYVRKPGLGVWAAELKDSHQFIGASGLVYNDNRHIMKFKRRISGTGWFN